MNANLSAQPSGTRELRLAGRLATRKSRLKSLLQLAQGIIVGLEYTTYLITFVLLFAWKVAAEHLTAAFRWHVWRWPDIPVIDDYALFLGVFLLLYWYLLYQKQFYDIARERPLSEETVAIARVGGAGIPHHHRPYFPYQKHDDLFPADDGDLRGAHRAGRRRVPLPSQMDVPSAENTRSAQAERAHHRRRTRG